MPVASKVYYHIYNRGAAKQNIFTSDIEYRFFLYKIAQYRIKYSIKIATACIMPTHFHLLIRTYSKAENITQFMKSLQYSYAYFFNKRNKRKGHVFESNFCYKPIPQCDLPFVIRYIQQNPVRKKLVTRAEDWLYRI